MSLLVLVLMSAPAQVTPVSPSALDLQEYRSTDSAIAATVRAPSVSKAALPGYLGIQVTADAAGRLRIAEVHAGSPAAAAGLRVGDIVQQLDGKRLRSAAEVREHLQGREPGATVAITVERKQRREDVNVKLAATSRPLDATRFSTAPSRVYLGVQVGPASGAGVRVEQISPESPAATAGLAIGDLILEIDGKAVAQADFFRELLSAHKPGDVLKLAVQRAGKGLEVMATLTPNKTFNPKAGGQSQGADVLPLWKKEVYRLGVVLVGFADVRINDKIATSHWEEALFSWGTYRQTATGQAAFGSLNDYYHDQSYGKLRIEGRVFAPVTVARKRAEYAPGAGTANKTGLLVEALDKLSARDGKDALKNLDGLCFVYAGGRVQTNRGSLYFPHRGSVTHRDRRWPYMLAPEGGEKMESISVFAPEFGKLLGLPELFARPENAGSEGLGSWCLMSDGAGQAGKPAHLGAWCKEQLGWLTPVAIDPATPQKLLLAPVQRSPRECYKVMVRSDGGEYLLLENRSPRGFDADLPGHGLLIWRVVNGRPILEESHGIAGPSGPRAFADAVPYPSKHNNAFTPHTTPSSRPVSGGAAVHITNIRRLSDGRIALDIGYEYY